MHCLCSFLYEVCQCMTAYLFFNFKNKFVKFVQSFLYANKNAKNKSNEKKSQCKKKIAKMKLILWIPVDEISRFIAFPRLTYFS